MESEIKVSLDRPLLSVEDLSLFHVLEITLLDHGDDGEVDCALVVEPHKHFLLEFQVRDLSANGHSPSDCLLDSLTHVCQLLWCLVSLCV